MQPPLQRRRLRRTPPRARRRTQHPTPPHRRVRIPPSVERREASRLRNLRRRIPFIATRDSINTACDRCGPPPPGRARGCGRQSRRLSPSRNGKTSAVFEILERYATFVRERHGGGGRPVWIPPDVDPYRNCFLRLSVCYWNESINWRNSVHTWASKVDRWALAIRLAERRCASALYE